MEGGGWRGPRGAYFALNLIYILRSEGLSAGDLLLTHQNHSQGSASSPRSLEEEEEEEEGDFSLDEEPLLQTRSPIRKSSQMISGRIRI